MLRLILLTLVFVAVPPLAAQQQEAEEERKPDPLHPRVKMATTLGEFVLELDAEKAPVTVDNFLRYADDGFYDGTIFHRVMSSFMIQGGGFTVEMDKKSEGLRAPIKNEWQNGLKNERGTIAMARKGWNPRMPESMRRKMANSATAQFFINVVDNPRLDRPQPDGAAYCVFGKVVEGVDVVDKIKDVEVIKHPKYQPPGRTRPDDPPVTPKEAIVIKSVTLLDGLSYADVAAVTKPAVEAAAKAEAEQAQAEAEAKAKARAEAAARAKAFKELLTKGEDEEGNKLHKSPTGLMYVILREGEGPSPTFVDEKLRGTTVTDWLLQNKDAKRPPTMDKVEVHYTGWLMDGTQFDSSRDRGRPVTLPLNGFINGWCEGASMMKVGGRRLLIIPADLAYGAPGFPPRIGPNATLVFDIELLGIK